MRPIARNRRPIARERSRTRARLLADQRGELATLPGQRPHAGRRQPGVGRVLDVGLDHGRVDPHRPRPEPLLPRRLPISARVSSLTVSAPIRRVSLRIVDSSGTRSDSEIRQNRRR